jgi:DNA-binding response OmpR family regulator
LNRAAQDVHRAVQQVLIADPDATLRQQLYSALLQHDVFSDCVLTADDALRHLNERAYGVVVMDVSLPGIGIERVTDRIASMPAEQRPVVLILATRPEATRSLDVEIVQIVLRKPVHLIQLVDLVRSCLRSAAGRDLNRKTPRRTDDQWTS